MFAFPKKLLGVEVMEKSEDNNQGSHVSSKVLKENTDFREFAARMTSANKVYFIVDKNGTSKQLANEDNSDSTPQRAEGTRDEWLDCCLRDYLQRKQQFDRRCGSRQKVVVRAMALLLLFLALLWYCWPLWNFLIDVDAEMYFKTLDIDPSSDPSEVKRAYREQVKKWHPDRNPGCGEPCRSQMRKIQQAHDVLMARGDHRMELANRYRSELLQVRSLIFYRVYEMAGNSAQEFFNIVLKLHSGPRLSDATVSTLRIASSVATVLFFTAYETLYVGGFNVIMILQVFFLVVSTVASAKREGYVAKARKAAYVDVVREAAVMILPLAVGGFCSVLARADAEDRWEELFRVAFGCFYVSAYLYRFMPNIYDNIRKRSCTITMNYFSTVTEPTVSLYGVVTAELGFLVDDLFAFTCRVPPAFRLFVFVSHVLYLCEFAMLPWEGPLRGAKAGGGKTTSLTDETQDGTAAHNASASASSPLAPGAASRFLSVKDLQRVSDLDGENIDWRIVGVAPYRNLQLEGIVTFARQHNVMPLASDVVACSDFESVAITATVPDSAGAASTVKHEVVLLLRDPATCRVLALNSGPMGMVPAPNTPRDPNLLRSSYAKVFGSNAGKTASQIWRSRTKAPHAADDAGSHASMSFIVLPSLLLLLLVALALLHLGGHVASPLDVFRATATRLPKTMQPLALQRFSQTLAPEHPINSMAVGLVTLLKGQLVLCTIDIWDTVRQLHLYGRGGARQR